VIRLLMGDGVWWAKMAPPGGECAPPPRPDMVLVEEFVMEAERAAYGPSALPTSRAFPR
jgi:hypothetical protein